MANPYEQMAQSLGEAGVNLSGTKTYSNYEKSQKLAGGDRDETPSTRPRARPESRDTSESPTISIVDADTNETVANWDVGSGDVTFSGDSSLSETTQRRKKSKSGLSISEPKINIGPLEIKEKDAKLDVSMDWSNVFDNLLKDAMPRGVDLNRFKTSWDGETIKLLDVGMSFAEGGKVSDEAQLEMDLIMNEQVDPVSGNTAPIGAKPEEVRDDVEIRVSPGEYVINAQTVRYFGEDFFDELQKTAEEGFERIKEGEELPFRDDELDIEDDEIEEVEPEGFAYGGRVKGYAEGDMVVPQPVGGGYGQYGGTGAMFMGYQSKTFINDETGQKIIIFFFNGRPLSRIPAGFREMGETPAEEQKTAAQKVDSGSKDKPLYEEIQEQIGESWRTKNPKDWTPQDHEDYYNSLRNDIDNGRNPLELNTFEKGASMLLGGVGGVLSTITGADTAIGSLIKKGKKNKAQKVFDHLSSLEKSNPLLSDTRYILGSALGVEGYDPAVANPGTYDKETSTGVFSTMTVDRGEFVNVPAFTDRLSDGTTIFVPSEEVFVGDVEEYYRLGGLRPRSRPPEKDESGRYINPDKPRSATPEAIAKYTDSATGEEDIVTGTKFTEMLGGLKAGVSRSKADVETENLARAAGVSVDTYKGMSAYERSEALGGGGGAADDRERAQKAAEEKALAAKPRPPSGLGREAAKKWLSDNGYGNYDKKDAPDVINGLQQDWDRLNK